MKSTRNHSLLFIIHYSLLIGLLFFLFPTNAEAQDTPTGNVANGLGIYQQRCATCHGVIGLGDGEIADQAINPPTPLADTGYLRSAVPSQMYEVISQGRLQRGMPPFGESSSNPLTDQQIYDVISAVYAYGTTASDLTDADEYATLLAPVDWANMSNRDVFNLLETTGLEEEEKWRVVDTGRMNALAYRVDSVELQGTIINGTTATVANQPTEITLLIFEEFNLVQEETTTSNNDGTYNFTLDNAPADWFMRTVATFEGINYPSGFVAFSDQAVEQLETIVYEPTESADSLKLERIQLFVEALPQSLAINEVYTLSNNGRTLITSGFDIPLSPQSLNVSFSDILSDGRFSVVPEIGATDIGYRDPRPIFPGQNSVNLLARYNLPYDGRSFTLAHLLPLETDTATVLVPEGMTITGEGWFEQGIEFVNGEPLTRYERVSRSDQFALEISGQPDFVITAEGARIPVRNERRELLIGGIALLASVAFCSFLIIRWQKESDQALT